MMAAKTLVHVADAAQEQGYIERRREMVAAVELGGVRTYLVVPMVKDGELIAASPTKSVRSSAWDGSDVSCLRR